MKRLASTAMLLVLVSACTETDLAPPETTAAEAGGSFCGAYVPPTRAWNGYAKAAPTGEITLVLRARPQTPTVIDAFYIDRKTKSIYDVVAVKRSDLGGMMSATVSLNQDLAIVGNATGPIPGGGGGPRGGQEPIYALEMAARLEPMAYGAELAADACPK